MIALALAGVLIFALAPRRERWDEWAQHLYSAAIECQEKDACLAETLARQENSEPPLPDNEPVSHLVRDLTVGHIIEDTEPFKDRLMDRLGISGQYFVGSGFSLPVAPIDANNPMLPEYLVPNYPETLSNVWLWEVDMDAVGNKPLKSLLLTERPLLHQFGFPRYYRNNITRHLDPGDQTPALVRFALIDPKHYSHCLGITTRTRVFASPLGLLLDSSLHAGYLYRARSTWRPKTAIGKEVVVDPTDANEDLTAEMLSATEVLIYQNATKRLGALRAKIRAFGIKSVARDSGVSRSQLQAIVNGGKTPHKATVAKLDAALGSSGN